MRYTEIAESEVPAGIRWDVPSENRGQIVEVAYGDPGPHRDESCRGAEYQRVTDASIAVGKPGRVTYARKARGS